MKHDESDATTSRERSGTREGTPQHPTLQSQRWERTKRRKSASAEVVEKSNGRAYLALARPVGLVGVEDDGERPEASVGDGEMHSPVGFIWASDWCPSSGRKTVRSDESLTGSRKGSDRDVDEGIRDGGVLVEEVDGGSDDLKRWMSVSGGRKTLTEAESACSPCERQRE